MGPDEIEKIDDMFSYHAPKGNQTKRYELIREAGRKLAHTIGAMCPHNGREAIKHVQLATMLANAEIACLDSEETPNRDMSGVEKMLEERLNRVPKKPDANDPFHNKQP